MWLLTRFGLNVLIQCKQDVNHLMSRIYPLRRHESFTNEPTPLSLTRLEQLSDSWALVKNSDPYLLKKLSTDFTLMTKLQPSAHEENRCSLMLDQFKEWFYDRSIHHLVQYSSEVWYSTVWWMDLFVNWFLSIWKECLFLPLHQQKSMQNKHKTNTEKRGQILE